MSFKRKNEFGLMREELLEYYYNEYAESCNRRSSDFLEKILSRSWDDVDSLARQIELDDEKSLSISSQKMKQVVNMSDGDVKQVYYQVFGRWSPIKP